MSTLRSDIARCMLAPPSAGNGHLAARFRFARDFSGFQGHFPGKPVLPAVCLIQAVLVMLERARGTPAGLRRIVSAKWQAPVEPDTEIGIEVREEESRDDGTVAVQARVLAGRSPIADMRLRVAFARGAKGGA